MGEVTLYSTSFTDLMWRRFIFSTGVRLMHYLMVIVMLPFEIIRGFFVNFELGDLQTLHIRSQALRGRWAFFYDGQNAERHYMP